MYNEALSSMSNEDLEEVLGKFVAEVRKEGQKKYPGKTLYEMICCIQAYFPKFEFCFKFSNEAKG